MDMDTIGTTRKFVLCVAENEDASPWPSFAEDRGFSADESTVSIFITDGELDVGDQGNTTADGLLKTLAYGMTFGNRSIAAADYHASGQRLVFMPPDVAGPVGAEGWSKQDASDFMHKHAYGSLGKFIQFMPIDDARVTEDWYWLRDKTEEERLEISTPLFDSGDNIDIVVIGADRAKTLVFPSDPSVVTIGIDQFI